MNRDPFRKLNRDLGIIVGLLGAAVLAIGAGIGIAVDVLWHRHRAA